jgi:hypothetical protein
MVYDYGEVFATFKGRGRTPAFELVGQNGIAIPSGGADFLGSMTSIAAASDWMTPIGSTSAL